MNVGNTHQITEQHVVCYVAVITLKHHSGLTSSGIYTLNTAYFIVSIIYM